MSKDPIYRWNGRYFGFIHSDRLFDANSKYLGWIDDNGKVWRHGGEYLGELVQDRYILRKTNMMKPMRRVPRTPPIPPIAPMRRMDKLGKMQRLGWVDALDEF